jgi:Tol biopolymer transport system component
LQFLRLIEFSAALMAVQPTEDERIFFASNRDSIYQIFTIDSDGKNLSKVTSDFYEHSSPSWSPDGKKIAFVSDRDGNYEIYVMNAETFFTVGFGYFHCLTGGNCGHFHE